MKTTWLLIVLSSFAFASAAQQAGAQQPSAQPKAQPPGAGQGSATPAPQDQQMQMQMQQMQQMEGRMAEMRAQMDRIQKTTDPAERQRLMDEHAQSMQQGMMMMGQMMHGPGGGPMQAQCAQNDTQCQMQRMQGQQQMMGQRMGMMQMMMEQMMGQMMGMGQMMHGAQPPSGGATKPSKPSN